LRVTFLKNGLVSVFALNLVAVVVVVVAETLYSKALVVVASVKIDSDSFDITNESVVVAGVTSVVVVEYTPSTYHLSFVN
jgi:hypothetical protein